MSVTKTLQKQGLEVKRLEASQEKAAGSLVVKRLEAKYFISQADCRAMSEALDNALERDSHDRGKGYFIRSLYFDSLENRAFEEKMAGIERRKKFRLRLYDFDSNKVKLEVKSKFNSSIFKESMWISKKHALELQKGSCDVLLDYENALARKVFAEFTHYCYSPVVVVDYVREAFLWPFNNVRVTFDQGLKSNSIDLNMFDKGIFMKPLISQNLAVLEVKFDHFLPEWLKSLIRMRSCNSAISKYCVGRLDNKIGWV
jgi:hypothetical protein